jgi:chemosensory pili system protein ChpA (sensor histidine kinase/response regulator)
MTDLDQQPDQKALRWVKEELDKLIHEARTCLEQYVDAEFSGDQLKKFSEHLHKILGTLKMIQVHGAVMLVEQMELAANESIDNKIEFDTRAAEILMLSIAQLPVYLERIEYGEADIPLVLLPVLNDLKALRGEEGLSEIALYAPQLDYIIEAEPVVPGSGNPELGLSVRRARSKFQRGLLLWYRDKSKKTGLDTVLKIVRQINADAGTNRLRRLLDAAEALVVVLQEGEFDASAEVKLLFGEVDRVFKNVTELGEEGAVKDFPLPLLKKLLYFVSRSTSHDSVVQSVKKSADLANSFSDEIDAARHGSSTNVTGADVINAVRGEIQKEISKLKDDLDNLMRGDTGSGEKLAGMQQSLKSLGDTLGMVGRGDLRTRLMNCIERLEADNPSEIPEPVFMDTATDILAVETALSALGGGEKQGGDGKAEPVEAHIRALIQEAFVEFRQVKSALDSYFRDPDNPKALEGSTEGIGKLVGVFGIAELGLVATMLERIQPYVESLENGEQETPNIAERESLVDVFAGIEYYLECYLESNSNLEDILKFSYQALQGMGLADGLHYFEVEEAELEVTEIAEAIEVAEVAETEASEQAEEEAVAEEAEEAEEIPEIEAVPEMAETETPADLTEETEAKEEEVLGDEEDVEGIDSEIFEIFLEEAAEVLGTITEAYPKWRKDAGDEDSLGEIRRSFHTLKGSGRLGC